MAVAEKKKTLSGLPVSKAMRKQVVSLSQNATIGMGINSVIKYKINAFLVLDENGGPAGVVSKTDIMGAYYAGLPLETTLDNIMSSPPLFCRFDATLESALEKMKTNGIYRLYVTGDTLDTVTGTLAYPDIVGLLYQYCHECEYGHLKYKRKSSVDRYMDRYKVCEVMTSSVKSCRRDASIVHVIEELSKYRFGAILIADDGNFPWGVVSKTDLALAYKHGVDLQIKAGEIMSSPVGSCDEDEFLEDAIHKMIFTDVHRLFVYKEDSHNIVGVLSLSDAARIRSGSCHACVSSRIRVDQH